MRNCRSRQYLFHKISDRLSTCISPEYSVALVCSQFNPLIVWVQLFSGMSATATAASLRRTRDSSETRYILPNMFLYLAMRIASVSRTAAISGSKNPSR